MVRIRIGQDEHRLTWDEWEERVRTGRIPADALVHFEAVTGPHFVRAGDLEMYRSLRNDAAIAWQGQFLSGPPPLMTALLIGVQVRIWWAAKVPGVEQLLVSGFTNWTSPALEEGQTYRMLTMGVLHTDLLHIVLNMMWLAYTGWNIERALGRLNLLVIYFAAVLGGSLLSMFGTPETPSLGASGGVFGLVAASVAFGFSRPDLLPARGRRLFGAAMAPYLVLMFWSGLMNEDTDNWSHLGGLLTGGVLALLLDPAPLQRKPGWNARIHAITAVGAAALILSLGALGPRVHPILDSEEARAAHLPKRPTRSDGEEERYRPLVFGAPVGWKPGVNSAGDPAFTSPAAPGRRSWSVREGSEASPVTAEELGAHWVDKLRRGWPDAEVEPPRAAELAGREGLRIDARVGLDDEERTLSWIGVTRGTRTLQRVWEVDDERARRLEPLEARLHRSVTWESPADLVAALRDVEHMPGSAKARKRLAAALARVGEFDRALDIAEELVAERPENLERWLLLVETANLATDRDPSEVWRRALQTTDNARVALEIVAGLEAREREAEGRGLLELGWSHWPADRGIRRARRTRRMSTALDDETGLPWHVAYRPADGLPRTEAERTRLAGRPVDVGDAAQAERDRVAGWAELEVAIIGAIESGSDDAVGMLLLLRHGAPPLDVPDARSDLARDLGRAVEGDAVRWLPEAIAEAIRQHPELSTALSAEAARAGP